MLSVLAKSWRMSKYSSWGDDRDEQTDDDESDAACIPYPLVEMSWLLMRCGETRWEKPSGP